MPLNKALVDVLACPKCKGALELAPDESGFTCRTCRLVYPVVDGIPNFIIEEAKPLSEQGQPG